MKSRHPRTGRTRTLVVLAALGVSMLVPSAAFATSSGATTDGLSWLSGKDATTDGLSWLSGKDATTAGLSWLSSKDVRTNGLSWL